MADHLADSTSDFKASVARALGLNPAVEHPEAHIILSVADMKARIDAIDRATPQLHIPGPDSPVTEVAAAIRELQTPVASVPSPFEADATVRQACANILVALITGQRPDNGSLALRRTQALEIKRRFRAAGWESVTAGGVDNSPPYTGDNELWTVSVV